MSHSPEHICAALPKTHVSVHLVYCRVHQAWTLTHHVYEEDGESFRDLVPYHAVELGPFDDLDDVQRLVTSMLGAGPLP